MNFKILILATFALFLTVFSCKKKEEKETVTPQPRIETVVYKFLDSLKANISVAIDFGNTPSSIFFKAKFDKVITWKLTITGDTSGATKTFIGTSSQLDSTNTLWDGGQDDLYYFTKETCKVTLTDYNPASPSTSTHSNSTIINISRPKALQQNAVVIFDRKRINGARVPYLVAYDSESCSDKFNAEADPLVYYYGVDDITCLSKKSLPFSTKGGPINRYYKPSANGAPINSPYYFLLKGTDSYNNDNYIGRIEYFRNGSNFGAFLDNNKGVKSEDIWFNVFVYGTNDGSMLNYTIKEDDDQDGAINIGKAIPCGATKSELDLIAGVDFGLMDDAFYYPILLNFTGWKLISVPYSQFSLVFRDGIRSNGKGELNPDNIFSVQFSLSPSKAGGSAQAIFDYPVLSIGGPLKY